MSNYCGSHWNVIGGGKSAFWNNKGKKMNQLNSEKKGLLIAENNNNNWTLKSIQI